MKLSMNSKTCCLFVIMRFVENAVINIADIKYRPECTYRPQ